MLDKPTSTAQTGTRPTLLFIHPGVSDHTFWDAQTRFFTARGWTVLRFDLFGYGRSVPGQDWTASRPLVNAVKHARLVISQALPDIDSSIAKVIPIGCSKGGCLAVDLTITHPDLVAGVAVVAGFISGFDGNPPLPGEKVLIDREEACVAAGDVEGAVQAFVHYWADGPLQ